MRNIRDGIVLLGLGLCAGAALAQPSGMVYLFAQGTADGTMYEFSIAGDRGARQPRWDPNDGPPPLAIAAAIRTGEAWLKGQSAEIKQFELTAVALAKFTYPRNLADRWYYRIEFDPVVAGQRLHGGQFTAVVLLDGTVVEPHARKQVEIR